MQMHMGVILELSRLFYNIHFGLDMNKARELELSLHEQFCRLATGQIRNNLTLNINITNLCTFCYHLFVSIKLGYTIPQTKLLILSITG